ncbi:Glycerol-3-phosphate dehydrogenase [NAD(P)+] [Porphyromonas levii]|uniref:NAD(P)H-dependent glycerol-3-phosphate dehydrogenase n=1 Tax=Porphyromonas levii TaxID=28114 RepID=UPI001B8BA574|nr:NAD(P)H-dependent glycerol-3-phosphate dehydrogenase [Porphyromonas levii]MBR8729699.1 Glycerol-3-phosphate dehydrogenase [NAD(P)+] [Porphyromonas levii]MBR8774187.1 Glycerol-3-phosphate dehydrogenase [NAD(P)+] [Porphyromonas levii]MBR8784838.1 Glycerol-3-phosphate dehydrogenase [NAD(P)+] [Porphyromonas levii]
MNNWEPGRIGIIGSGSWATALAKIVMEREERINWYFRFGETVRQFRRSQHNPTYLTTQLFDTERIDFFTDIPSIVEASDTLILVTPSPYIKGILEKAKKGSLQDKFVLNAIKGIIPDDYVVISDYLRDSLGVPDEQIGVISGPTHAEEVALNRLSYLTLACSDVRRAEQLSKVFQSDYTFCKVSSDVTGIELGSVLKNIYAIASGVCQSLRMGDNFQAVLISNATKEMARFLARASSAERNINDSVYLGDLLVTGYSRYSRNRTLGTLIGKGYSVKQAQAEMEMTAEGYYGAKCINELNKKYKVDLPIAEAVYDLLYNKEKAKDTFRNLSLKLT